VINVSGRLNPLIAASAVGVIGLVLAGIASIGGGLPRTWSNQGAESVAASGRAPTADAACWRCGTVEAIRAVEVRGEPGVSAAVNGQVPGHPVGDHQMYRVIVRMEDGSFRTVSSSSRPRFTVGDKVRIEQGALIAAGS
jgi:hypothetical protein